MMEKQTCMNFSIRNTQLISFLLFNISTLVGITLTILALFGVSNLTNISSWINPFFAVCSLMAYLLLSRIANNLPTRNVTKYVGVILCVIAILSFIFSLYRNSYEVTPTQLIFFKALFGLLKTVLSLYLLGVIVRNNSNCSRAKRIINVYFIVVVIGGIFAPSLLPSEGLKVASILIDLTSIVCTYILFSSDVFSGATNHEPAPKGAYRFWNKYFAWYIIVTLALSVFGVLFH